MTHYFIVPGLGNSGPEHWQTYFEKSLKNCQRIEQANWDTPDCIDWVNTFENKISSFQPETVILIGHSLGCTAIAQWAKIYKRKIKGALLVAPSDVEDKKYTFNISGFTPIPQIKFNFPSKVVYSTNDPWVNVERALFFATNWGSKTINMRESGHINADSGFGEWENGLKLLYDF